MLQVVYIAVVEDCESDCRHLCQLLHDYSELNKHELKIDTFENGEQLLAHRNFNYNIIFMDIELGTLNGIEVSAKIREKNEDVMIILTTNLMQYAIEGYSVQAADYILKPVQYDRIKSKMDDIINVLKKKNRYIISSNKTGMKKYMLNQIFYIEVFGHRLYVHTKDGPEEIGGTLKKMEEDLQLCGFVKCNKCYLVNLEYVNRISGDMVEVGGDLLKISRREKKNFITEFTRYVRR